MGFRFLSAFHDGVFVRRLHTEPTSVRHALRRPSTDWQTALAVCSTAPSPRSVASTIALLGKARQWQHALTLLAELRENKRDIVCYNALLTCLVRSDQAHHAVRTFHTIPMADRTAPTYGALISAYSALGQWERALSVVEDMPAPNAIAYTAAIRAMAVDSCWEVALRVFEDMQRKEIHPTAVTYGTVLDVLAKADSARSWEFAIDLLGKLGAGATVIHYGATLHACASAGRWLQALNILQHMERNKVRPNIIAHNCVLRAFSVAGEWKQCLAALSAMRDSDTISVNTAITSCATTLQWQAAIRLLGQYENVADIVSYNTTIQACGRARQWARALHLFTYAQQERHLAPTPQTFRILLNALAQGGQWQRALDIYAKTEGGPTPHALHAVLAACADASAWERALQLAQDSGIAGPATLRHTMAACVRAGEWHRALNLFKTEPPVGLSRVIYILALQASTRGFPSEVPEVLERMRESHGFVDAAAYAVALQGTTKESSILQDALDASANWALSPDTFVQESNHALQLLHKLGCAGDTRFEAFACVLRERIITPLLQHIRLGEVEEVRRFDIPTVGIFTRDILDGLGIGTFDATDARARVKLSATSDEVRAQDVVVHLKVDDGDRIFRYGRPPDNAEIPAVFLHHDRSGHAERRALCHLTQRVYSEVEFYVTHRPCVSCLCAFAAFRRLRPQCDLKVVFDELDCE